jgi:hypothetical protein
MMKYLGSEKVIRLGDHVVYAGNPGVVVFMIEDDSYSDRYDKKSWSYLNKGFGVELQDGTLYHFDSPDEDLELVL